MEKTGVILINLGTPSEPTPVAVKQYLREFLMDPYVVSIPFLLRWILVYGVITPRRSYASAEAYKKVWTERGSPLFFHTEDQTQNLREALPENYVVEFAMRYGNPSIQRAVEKVVQQGCSRVVGVPLFPQYSESAWETASQKLKKCFKNFQNIPLQVLPPFYREEGFLSAYAEQIQSFLQSKNYDLVLFSFHGLPVSHIKKLDSSKNYCLVNSNCCESDSSYNKLCYRHHCFYTAREIAKKIGLESKDYRVCFQSRLGIKPWIQPYTDELYRVLPTQGVKRIAVVCPSFVSDCLETLEEIQIRGKEEFIKNGGEDLFLIPCLNNSKSWIRSLAGQIQNLSV